MRLTRTLVAVLCVAAPIAGATFGTVVPSPDGVSYSDIVLDEARSRLYLVASAVNRVDIYNYKTRTFLAPFQTDLQPVSAAISRDGKFLYVTAYTAAFLDVFDLNLGQRTNPVQLATNPEGVAVGADGRVLITAVGTGTSTVNTLLIYDPSATATNAVSSVPVVPPVATPPVLPTPSGRVYNSYRSRLLATPDGRWIVGVNGNTAASKVVFLYESASGTVLRSRLVTNLSTVLAVSADGSKFMAGPTLFDSQTLQVTAQENAANAPFVFPAGTAGNFNTQQNQGGSVFSPDGTVLYGAFNIAPVGSTRANITELLVNDPDNLLINLGIQLPENLAGKMVIDGMGANVYALSDSGLTVLPVGTINQFPLAVPQSQSVLLIKDPCGAFNGATASDVVANAGKSRFTISVTPYTEPPNVTPFPFPFPVPMPLTPATSITTPGPGAQAVNGATPQVNFTYSPAAGANPGTIGPSDFLVSSNEAINIPGNIHVYQNYRDSVTGGTVVPVSINALSTFGLADIVLDSARQRLYIANSGLNRLEVFDTKKKVFLSPIKVGQLPIGMAFGSGGNTLYVANAGGESISTVDLTRGLMTGHVVFPAFPFNAALPISAPVAIAASGRGPLFVMSAGGTAGTIWKIDGNQAIPRSLNPAIFGNGATAVSGGSSTATGFWSLAATPAGEFVLLMTGTGNAYLYDYTIDDFTVTKQVLQTPLIGFRGPVTAGPQGRYYAVGGTILNSSLTPGALGSLNGTSPGGRPVAAVAAVSSNQVALFTQPVRGNPTAVVPDAGLVELYDPATGASAGNSPSLEGPASVIIGGNGSVTQFSRTLVVDPSGPTAYALTATGLSIIALGPVATNNANRPSINPGGVVSLGNYLPALAPGGLMTIFGRNLGSTQTAAPPLPTVLGGICLTLNNTPIPMAMTSAGQINAQIPVSLPAGRYPLVIRSLDNQLASTTSTVTISKYAPAVLVGDQGQAAIFHSNGGYVDSAAPAKRDETLTIYATGMGVTHGGPVATGAAAPSSPLADTDTVLVYFGNPNYKQSQMIVHSSSLIPGVVGIAQISVTVPGFHSKGAALPVTLKIGGVSSPITGPAVPYVSVK